MITGTGPSTAAALPAGRAERGPVHILFASSPRPTLGVEWELQLVDLRTRALRNSASELLGELGDEVGERDAAKAKHELFESTIEIVTGVCDTVPEAKDDLSATLAALQALAGRRGLGITCSGTHPIAHYADQRVSPDPRYHRLVDSMQWLARRLLVFGVHVHVGVRSAAKAIPVVNALTAYVPHFLALSASSPFWLGNDTGLASSRTKVFESLPTAGLPYRLADWAQFEDLMETLVASGTVKTIRDVWWDVRPHPDFGTVELRVCDGLPSLLEVGAVTALAQCLVDRMDTLLDRGRALPVPPPWVVSENKWRAARFGLDAKIVVDGRGRVRPVRCEIAELVEELLPVAARLGCRRELTNVVQILSTGASYARQQAVARRHAPDLAPVVDSLLSETRRAEPVGYGDLRPQRYEARSEVADLGRR